MRNESGEIGIKEKGRVMIILQEGWKNFLIKDSNLNKGKSYYPGKENYFPNSEEIKEELKKFIELLSPKIKNEFPDVVEEFRKSVEKDLLKKEENL